MRGGERRGWEDEGGGREEGVEGETPNMAVMKLCVYSNLVQSAILRTCSFRKEPRALRPWSVIREHPAR